MHIVIIYKKSLSWLIFEAKEVLEIKTSMLFILDFANNDKNTLNYTAIAQVYNFIAEVLTPIKILSK